MTIQLVAVELGDRPEAWRAAGFDVVDDHFVVGGVQFHCTGTGDGPGGIQSWTLVGSGPERIDGLATSWRSRAPVMPTTVHRNRAVALDHLVIGSPDRDRTTSAFASALGLAPRSETEHALYGRPMVQTFFLLRPTLLEVISRPDDHGESEAVFWGLAFVSDDLDATSDSMAACEPPHKAVQPGRRIASVHGQALGISIPLAFLSPREP